MSQKNTDDNAITILKEIRDLLQSIEQKIEDGIDVQVQNSVDVLLHDSVGESIFSLNGWLWVTTS
jgi:hypothetical protein